MTPGVLITPAAAGVEAGQFSSSGQRADANYLTIDGVSVNDGIELTGLPGAPAVQQTLGGAIPAYTALGSMQSLVSLEAIEEFRMQTSSSGVDAGRMPGAHLAIITRSGTNQLHGSFFNYFRNEALDANDWFANQGGQPRGPFRLNDFGGTLGGPIVRNRTFFFFSEENLRLQHSLPEMQFLPTLDTRLSAPASTLASAQRASASQWTGALARFRDLHGERASILQRRFDQPAYRPHHRIFAAAFRALQPLSLARCAGAPWRAGDIEAIARLEPDHGRP